MFWLLKSNPQFIGAMTSSCSMGMPNVISKPKLNSEKELKKKLLDE